MDKFLESTFMMMDLLEKQLKEKDILPVMNKRVSWDYLDGIIDKSKEIKRLIELKA